MAATRLSEVPEGRQTVGVGGYAWYALFVLVLVYSLNFIDRQILSILAEDIKGDLGLEDAEIGFLYGTAFAVFYALFGIPLGRLADSWYRGRLMAIGLALWSSMTALSGFAGSLSTLAVARIGVGIGEASASPAAYSMIADYFPKEKRATGAAWVGAAVATLQDLVLPRMRATAGATYILGTTMVGLALGPYYAGKMADITGSLSAGIFALYIVPPFTLAALWHVSRSLADAEATSIQRARAAGEPI